jgi:hypothetical protein
MRCFIASAGFEIFIFAANPAESLAILFAYRAQRHVEEHLFVHVSIKFDFVSIVIIKVQLVALQFNFRGRGFTSAGGKPDVHIDCNGLGKLLKAAATGKRGLESNGAFQCTKLSNFCTVKV